jgi:hypothetical protein
MKEDVSGSHVFVGRMVQRWDNVWAHLRVVGGWGVSGLMV